MADRQVTSGGAGDTTLVSVGDVPDARRWPVWLMSILWLAWIAFLGLLLMLNDRAAPG